MKNELNFQITPDLVLKGYIYQPETYNAIVIVIHGMAEHIERYDEFMTFLENNNFLTIGYNQRGHGKTAGNIENCGYMDDFDNFEALVKDVYKVVEETKKNFPDKKIFLFGHSMGSFVTERYIELYGTTIDGVILSGSSLNTGLTYTIGGQLASLICKFKGRKHRSKFIHKLGFSAFNKKFKNPKTEVDWLSRVDENNIKYLEDPYCGIVFTVSYYKDLIKGFKNISKNFDLVPTSLPIYIMSGTDDPVGNFSKGTKKLYEQYKKQNINDLIIDLYDEGRHEMLNEINKNEVMTNILNWLNNHL